MNFFEHCWKHKKLLLEKRILKVSNEQSATVILSCNLTNYERFFSLNSFKQIIKNANCEVNIYDVQLLQQSIFEQIQNMKLDKNKILNALNILNSSIELNEYDFIKNFIENIEILDTSLQEEDLPNDSFHTSINILNEISKEILNLELSQDLQQKIIKANELANNSKFIISVTGVINAGKSSMLNALLDREILGTANIPETVNLTFLTFANDEYIEVQFNDYTKKRVNLNELKNYTSAKNEQANGVKLVELGINSDFLKSNITIIDTPGIDDTNIEREELTKSHMKKSDFIIHLMNATQSTTRKDIDFIIDTLKTSKTSGFCIALTHIDTISLQELNEVIEYSRNSIKNELKESGFGENLIQSVDFFGIDSKSKNGLNNFKNYLLENLFSDGSEKTNFILTSYKKELIKVLDFTINELEFKQITLFQNSNELQKQDELLSKKMQLINQEIQNINSEIKAIENRLDLDKITDLNSLNYAFEAIIGRVIMDVKYSKDKKLLLNQDRIKTIIQSGFDDAITDFTRDFERVLNTNLTNILQLLKLKFQIFENIQLQNFNLKDFIQSEFKTIDLSSLKDEFLKEIKNFSDLNSLKNSLLNIINKFVIQINLKNIFLQLANSCIKNFVDDLEFSLNEYIKNESKKQEQISEQLLRISENQSESAESFNQIQSKLTLAYEIKKRIVNC